MGRFFWEFGLGLGDFRLIRGRSMDDFGKSMWGLRGLWVDFLGIWSRSRGF
jgi:hypothetical protein